MIKKRYVIIALGTISVLLAGLFYSGIILAQSGEYDPWLDYNEDGTIDVNDLSLLGQAYGSLGDSTKNVYVTNWPEPQKPTYAEIRVLRGFVHHLRKSVYPPEWDTLGVLVDENMPNLPHRFIVNSTTLYTSLDVPTEWEKQSDANFTYLPANSPFFIQGEATIRPTVFYDFETTALDSVYCDIVVHLEKVNPEATTILSSDIISLARLDFNGETSGTWESIGVILDIPSPVVVNPGERLQIRLETFARCDNGFVQLAWIELYHTLGTDEFVAYIPIPQS